MIKRVLIVVPPLINTDEGSDYKGPDFERYRLISPVEPTSVAADLLKRGFDVKIFDMGTYKTGRICHLKEYIDYFVPDAVAIVQGIMTFATAQDWDGKAVFDLCPSTVRILTGIHATNYPGKAVTESVCDYSIKGEVDFVLGDLLTMLNTRATLRKYSTSPIC